MSMAQRKIKVIIISHLFPNIFSTPHGIFIYEQLKKLSRLCELKVIVPAITSATKKLRDTFMQKSIFKKYTMDGLDIIYIKAFESKYIKVLKITSCIFSIRIYRVIKRELHNFKYDLIHGHFIFPDGYIAVLLSKIVRKPVVLTAHGSDINIFPHEKWFNKFLVKWVLSQASKVVVVSNALKKQAIQLGVDDRKVAVIPNGFDGASFKPINKNEARDKLNLSKDNKYFLFVGNFKEIKNIPFLIKAFSEVGKEIKNASLILVGSGSEEEKFRELTDNLGIKDRVLFIGQRPHSDIPLWMNACDVLCLSSDNEGWPTVISEALACGKPVVSTNVGGVPEILNSPDFGILVQKGDLKGYIEAMKEGLIKGWDSQKITSYAQEFTWEKIAQALHGVYCEILG